MQGIGLGHIDFLAGGILAVHMEGAEVYQPGAGTERCEEMDVADGMSLGACKRAKDLQPARSMASRQSEVSCRID